MIYKTHNHHRNISVGNNKNLFNVFDKRRTLQRLCWDLNITEILTIWSRQYPEKIEIGFSVVTGLQSVV
jgi:hypothetical protein